MFVDVGRCDDLFGYFRRSHGLEFILVEKNEEDEDDDEVVEVVEVNPNDQLHEFYL